MADGSGSNGHASTGNGADNGAAKLEALLTELREVNSDLRMQHSQVAKFRDLVAEAGRIQASFNKTEAKARRRKLEDLAGQVHALSQVHGVKSADVAEAHSLIQSAHRGLSDVFSVVPATGSLFTRMFLGRVNVRVPHRQDRLKLRDEYNKFKDRTNMAFIGFPLLRLYAHYQLTHVWAYTHWIYELTHIWLMYYYVSLALRENILKVNGSNIRPWWIYHHYVSAIMSVVVLTWPDGANYRRFNPQFSVFFLYQGMVQILQGWYQKSRHYMLRSLGKAGSVDVSQTETLTEMPKELYALVVIIFSAHLFQLYNGITLLQMVWGDMASHPETHWQQFREEMQCLVLGVMFCLLGTVNFHQTVTTLLEKRSRHKSKRLIHRALSGRGTRPAAAAAVTSAAAGTNASASAGDSAEHPKSR